MMWKGAELGPLVNILVSELISDRSISLCTERSLSGCQQLPMGRECHNPQLLPCIALFITATASLAPTPAVMAYAFLLILVGSRYTPVWSYQ